MRIISVVLLVLFPLQQEQSAFTIRVNGERIGREEFSILRKGDGFLATGRARLEFNGQEVDVWSRMELDAGFNPTAYEYRSPEQVLNLSIDGGTAEIVYSLEGQRTRQDIRFPAGAVIVDDNFFHHYMLLLYHVGASGGSVPVFVPQQMTLGSVQIKPTGTDTYELRTDNLQLRATTDESGRLLRLTSQDGMIVVER